MNYWFISETTIPFRLPFKHTAKTRVKTEAIFIKVSDGNINGFGESCPRLYVTQESKSSSVNYVTRFLTDQKVPASIEEILHWRDEFYSKFPKQYASWCAIELASLDFLAKKNKSGIFNFLNCGSIQVPKYSAVIGIDSYHSFLWKALRYKLYGLRQLKIKVSGNITFDHQRLKTAKALGFTKEQTRIDANNYFTNKQTAIDYIKQLSDYFWAVEEPLASKNIKELMDISHHTGQTIILDETINPDHTLKDLEMLTGKKIILNLRISRLGGLLSSLEIARECTKRKVPYLIGSHVGETSLLNRAALALCGKNIGQAVAIEGGFSTRLLKFDPAVPKVTFGYKGNIKNIRKVEASPGISTLDLKQWESI